MKVFIETKSSKNDRLSVATYHVFPDEGRVPLEENFVGSRRDALIERNRRCHRWSEVADEVEANEVPCLHQS